MGLVAMAGLVGDDDDVAGLNCGVVRVFDGFVPHDGGVAVRNGDFAASENAGDGVALAEFNFAGVIGADRDLYSIVGCFVHDNFTSFKFWKMRTASTGSSRCQRDI